MRELFVEKVIDLAGEFLDNNQRIKLKEMLTEICLNYHIEVLEQNQKQEIQKNNEEILNKFISSKEIEGCSVRTLKYYKDNITKMLDTRIENDVYKLVAKGQNSETEQVITYNENLKANIDIDQVVGKVEVYDKKTNEKIGESNIVSNSQLLKSSLEEYIIFIIKKFFILEV